LQPTAFEFLPKIAQKVARFCLHLASEFFDFACDLVYVHDDSLKVINENKFEPFCCSGASLNNDRLRVCVFAYKCGQ
jgi:hypothetical protein